MSAENLTVGYVSTYPPRPCGIATFTRDLAQALTVRRHVQRAVVVAIENDLSLMRKGNVINQYDRRSYVNAAGFLNESNVDVVNLQHEFGIFGGEDGEYVLDLCRNLEPPLVTTFHTVVKKPNEKMTETVREISNLSKNIVVTIEAARKLLRYEYGIDPNKIEVIRHGASVPDQRRMGYAKQRLHLRNRIVLSTAGLISSGKGIEHAIKSLPYLLKDWPGILYLVIGETHPEVRKREGEAYRSELMALVRQLRLERNVRFVDRYLPEDELSLHLQATDIYLAPYVGRDQVSSGTITIALSHGKAVVSTPTVFAEEALSNGRGLFCDFGDSQTIANRVQQILTGRKLRHRLEANAFRYGRELGWAKVADEYADVFRSAREYARAITETSELS